MDSLHGPTLSLGRPRMSGTSGWRMSSGEMPAGLCKTVRTT